MRLFGKKENGERFLVVGLGNPGKQYERSRHNMGYMAVDYIAEKYNVAVKRARFQSLIGELKLDGKLITLMKPTTYMNLSGNAVYEAARYYHIEPSHVIVLVDDISLPAGTVRIREKGSSGGHNGLKSIAAMLQSNDYPRIKIGVGDRKGGELADWVLDAPSAADHKLITDRYDDIVSAIGLICDGKLLDAQSRYNH